MIKRLNKSYYLLILLLSHYNLESMPEPYNSIELLPFDDHGWLALENKKFLELFVKKLKPKVVVELGSWLGKSAIFMGKLLDKDAKLYCIDHWQPDYNSYHGYFHNNKLAASKIPKLYQQFLSNVIHAKLVDTIIPMRMDTIEASKKFKITVNLIYIDAGHDEEEVFNDIMLWYPKLESKGIMCGDDWSWSGVPLAVNKASEKLKIKFYYEGNFWYFEPKN